MNVNDLCTGKQGRESQPVAAMKKKQRKGGTEERNEEVKGRYRDETDKNKTELKE